MDDLIFKKHPPDWNYKEILEQIEIFSDIYENRPIRNNKGGMKFPHAFALYFILKKINPSLVIESGVFKGQSTWLIEKTLPNANLICLDIDLSKRVYISKKAKYSNLDFKFNDFSKIPENTLVLFDDHVNHINRIKESSFFNIKNIVLEDNYKTNTGDFQTIKHCFGKHSFNHKMNKLSAIKTTYLFIKIVLKKIFYKEFNANKDLNLILNRIRDYDLYNNEFNDIEKIIDTYFEFPPILPQKFHTEKPLMENLSNSLKKYSTELDDYNHLTFIKLK